MTNKKAIELLTIIRNFYKDDNIIAAINMAIAALRETDNDEEILQGLH